MKRSIQLTFLWQLLVGELLNIFYQFDAILSTV